ncbi:MAG: DUF975 family protein [Clostridiaceae bacterium]|nr:DUF975 family protein [Clostridiaceae bacterium]
MIKNGAKRQLGRYMLPCIGVALIGSVVTTLFSMILTAQMPDAETLLAAEDITIYWPQFLRVYGLSLAFSILISPLTVGSYAFFTEVAREGKPPFSIVFNWLGEGEKLKVAYGANLWYLLIALKYAAVYGIPGAAVFYGSSLLFDKITDGAALALYLTGFLIFFAAILFAYAKVNAYLPALYMIAANPKLGVRATFSFCGNIMKKRVWEFFLFRLSFIVWDILAAFTFGLSVIYVTPYINLSVAGYTRYLKEEALHEMTMKEDPRE